MDFEIYGTFRVTIKAKTEDEALELIDAIKFGDLDRTNINDVISY